MGEGRPPPRPAPESPRSSCSERSVGLIIPQNPPGSFRRPRRSPRNRRIGPKEGGPRARSSFKRAARPSSHPRSFRRWRQFWRRCCPGPEARGAGHVRPGGAGWGGGQKRWVGAKVARCGEGSIRRAFAFAESVIVCRFFYKDWTTII